MGVVACYYFAGICVNILQIVLHKYIYHDAWVFFLLKYEGCSSDHWHYLFNLSLCILLLCDCHRRQ